MMKTIHTNTALQKEEVKKELLYRVLHLFNKRWAQGYHDGVMTKYSVLAAYANPYKDTVYINDDVVDKLFLLKYGDEYDMLYLKEEMAATYIKHEEGHVRDYQDRGWLRFTLTILLDAPAKLRLLHTMSQYTGVVDAGDAIEALKQYYLLKSERYANKYANLTYIDFL